MEVLAELHDVCAGLDLVQAVESRHLSDPLSHEALDMSSEPHYLIPPRYVRYKAAKARHLWCMHLPQGGHGEGSFIDTPSYNPKSVLWDSLSMDALRGKWGKGHVTRAIFDGEHDEDVVSPI